MIRDGTAALWSAIRRDPGGLAIIWYRDSGWRADLVEEVRSLLPPGGTVVVTDSVAEGVAHPSELVLLLSDDEPAMVADLEGMREMLTERTQPLVAFLMKNGPGQVALASAPGVASWARGSDPDPEALSEIDVAAERERFEREVGVGPAEWLATDHQPSVENLRRDYRAWLIDENS